MPFIVIDEGGKDHPMISVDADVLKRVCSAARSHLHTLAEAEGGMSKLPEVERKALTCIDDIAFLLHTTGQV